MVLYSEDLIKAIQVWLGQKKAFGLYGLGKIYQDFIKSASADLSLTKALDISFNLQKRLVWAKIARLYKNYCAF